VKSEEASVLADSRVDGEFVSMNLLEMQSSATFPRGRAFTEDLKDLK
jgi:hypothetical protein